MDELHGTLSGHATKKLCERALVVYEQTEYANLAPISVSHLYNLRRSKPYQNNRRHFERHIPSLLLSAKDVSHSQKVNLAIAV